MIFLHVLADKKTYCRLNYEAAIIVVHAVLIWYNDIKSKARVYFKIPYICWRPINKGQFHLFFKIAFAIFSNTLFVNILISTVPNIQIFQYSNSGTENRPGSELEPEPSPVPGYPPVPT